MRDHDKELREAVSHAWEIGSGYYSIMGPLKKALDNVKGKPTAVEVLDRMRGIYPFWPTPPGHRWPPLLREEVVLLTFREEIAKIAGELRETAEIDNRCPAGGTCPVGSTAPEEKGE